MGWNKTTDRPNRWKGLVVGILGGVAGLLAMSGYWQAVTAVTGEDPRQASNKAGPHTLDDVSRVGTQHKKDESSTEAVGRIVDQAVTGKPPSKETKSLLSNLVHWGYGLLVAGLYGALRGGSAPAP